MKYSIITVCFNSEKYISSAIESILNQTYQNIEYIIVDGVSTDSTVDIVKSYELQFNGRMKIISEKDNGIYDAMNKGIAVATGEIIGILNSDDFYANNFVLENVAQLFHEKIVDAVYGDLLYVYADNINKIKRSWKSGLYKQDSFIWGWMPPHPTFFVKREIYEKHGYYNINFISAADYEFMLRVIHKEHIKIAYLPEILVKMRTGGLSNQSIMNRIRGNNEDDLAWRVNDLIPKLFTRYLKPIRKSFQFFQRPGLIKL